MQPLELTENDAEYNPEEVDRWRVAELSALAATYLSPAVIPDVLTQDVRYANIAANAITASSIVHGVAITAERLATSYESSERVNRVGFTRRPSPVVTAVTCESEDTDRGLRRAVTFTGTRLGLICHSEHDAANQCVINAYNLRGVDHVVYNDTAPFSFDRAPEILSSLIEYTRSLLLTVEDVNDLYNIFTPDAIQRVAVQHATSVTVGSPDVPPTFSTTIGFRIDLWGQTFIGETPQELAWEIATWLILH